MRVSFIADIPTPYMSAAFSALASRVELDVIYSSHAGSRGMGWQIEADESEFTPTFVGGPTLKKRAAAGTDRYLSPKLLGILKGQNPEVIFSGGFGPHTFYALAYARRNRVPLVVYSDGWAGSEAGLSQPQKWARRLIVPRATGYVANSVVAAARFIELGAPPSRVTIAPHTTDLARWGTVPAKNGRGDGERLNLLYVGRLIDWKGVDRVISAVAEVQDEIPGTRLTIVGTGPHESALRQLARDLGVADLVEFAGFVDQDGLPDYFAGADVFAFPTLSEPFGVALLESAAAGLPHLASAGGGATFDLTVDGVTGFVVDPDDTKGFAAKIRWLAENETDRLAMGVAARARTTHRSPEQAARMYERAAMQSLTASVH